MMCRIHKMNRQYMAACCGVADGTNLSTFVHVIVPGCMNNVGDGNVDVSCNQDVLGLAP